MMCNVAAFPLIFLHGSACCRGAASIYFPGLVSSQKKGRKNYVGSENTPYINSREGDTLAQRAVSLPHQR
eukprot:1121755-Pelagomonas_calceolata.AAC.1